MGCVRIVDSTTEESSLQSFAELRRLQAFQWRDRGTDDVLRALSVHRQICPVIVYLRERIDEAQRKDPTV